MIIPTFLHFLSNKMFLIRKRKNHFSRGLIGIEAAMILIAFVIVAAALAFVVLNMGFATTQKTKTSIVSTLAGAGSSLQIQGKVFGWQTGNEVRVIGVPIKIASGGESVNLAEGFTSVKFVGATINYDDIYEGVTNTGGIFTNVNASANQAVIDFAGLPGRDCDDNPIIPAGTLTETCAYIYFTLNDNNNSILDQGEHAVLALLFTAGADAPDAHDKIKIELIPPDGAALTIERNVPNLPSAFVDLG